jgi:hypothetical protein
LPIYTVLIALVVPEKNTLFGIFNLQGVALFGLYLLGFFMALVSAWVMKVILQAKEKSIWEKMESNPNLSSKFHGDQNYIYDLHKDRIVFYPDDWIRSYKWEVRTRSELLSDNSNFKEIRKVIPHVDTAILAFHGKPMVHVVKDPIIIDNWI